MSADRFRDQVAVVTGGTSGIGRATVERLHAEGAAVVFCGRRQALGEEVASALASDRAVFMPVDVTARHDLERMYTATLKRFGRLDVVVNNAGNVVVGPTLDLKPTHWRRTLALNLDAVFDSCQVAIPHLRATIASGRHAQAAIVNVASLDATGADRGFAAYNAAKAGVLNFTRALALEFGPEGIRCNTVSPGAIDTPLAAMSTSNASAAAAFEAAIPLRRFGRAHEVAAAITFLAARRGQLHQRRQPARRRRCHGRYRPPRRDVPLRHRVTGPNLIAVRSAGR